MTLDAQNQQKAEPLKFPRQFDKCPACGSVKRVAQLVGAEEVAKGKLPKEIVMKIEQDVVPVTELKTILLGLSIVPVLIAQYDVCYDCGTKYCFEMDRKDMPTTEVQKMMGFQAAPPPSPMLMNRAQRRHP